MERIRQEKDLIGLFAVFVNMLTVLCGSTLGILFRSRIKQRFIDTILAALALITIVIGMQSALTTSSILIVLVCLVCGTLLGELLRIDDRIEGAGDWMKRKLIRGRLAEGKFTEGFVSACILFCVGSMTIMGSFEAGINHNYTIIFTKSALDFVSSIAFGAAMGIGVTFSALFVLVFQGGLTLLAGVLSPYLSSAVAVEMTAVGGVILMGMGLNMLGFSQKKIKVANMLPAIFLPIAWFPIVGAVSPLLG